MSLGLAGLFLPSIQTELCGARSHEQITPSSFQPRNVWIGAERREKR